MFPRCRNVTGGLVGLLGSPFEWARPASRGTLSGHLNAPLAHNLGPHGTAAPGTGSLAIATPRGYSPGMNASPADSPGEEIAHALTAALGVAAMLIGIPWLIVTAVLHGGAGR